MAVVAFLDGQNGLVVLHGITGTGSAGEHALGIREVALHAGYSTEVVVDDGAVTTLIGCHETVSGLVQLAHIHEAYTFVVWSAPITTVHTAGCFIHLQLVLIGFKQRCGVEHFFYRQSVWVGHREILQLLVRVTFNVVLEGDHRAAQGRKDLLFDFLIGLGDVLDLFLAAVLVVVHGQHPKDEVLVFDVGGAHERLEAFPVFTFRIVPEEAILGVNLGPLEQFCDSGIGAFGALQSEVFVQGDFTLGRSIGADSSALEHNTVVGRSKREEFLHLLHVFVPQLGGADIRAVVVVVDLSLLRVRHHALEIIFSHHKPVVRLHPIGGGDHTVAEHHRGEVHGLAAHGTADAQFESGAILHAFLIGHRCAVIKRLGGLERHHHVVSSGIFSLEALRFESSFTAVPHENRRGFDDGFFGEILLGEGSRKAQCDLATLHDEGFGVHREVQFFDGLVHFTQSSAAWKGEEKSECWKEESQSLAKGVLHFHESYRGQK